MSGFDESLSVQVITVVVTNIGRRGEGTEANPHRYVRQVWTTDGILLAETDAFASHGVVA